MELFSFAQVVLRRWWLLPVFGVLGLAAGVLVSLTQPPRYQSTVSLQLNPAAKSVFLPYTGEASPVTALAASYREVLQSRAFAQVVVERLRLPVDAEQVAAAIRTELVPNTNLLRLTVTWDHPVDAERLAQAVAEVFITENLRRQQADPAAQARLAQMEESAKTFPERLRALREQRDRLEQSVSRGDLSRLSEVNELDDRLASLEASYANLLVEISRAKSGLDTAAIVDNASPARPATTWPLGRSMVFGLLAGLALAAGVAYVLERLIDAIHGPEDVAAVSGSAPIAIVANLTGARAPDSPSAGLVALHAPASAEAEAFRTLRANLRFASLDRPLELVVVTSPGAGEGKTLVACNLAAALAQAGKRVLLVDADLRRPRAHRLFGLASEPGLTDLLQAAPPPDGQGESAAAGAAAAGWPTPQANLWLLPAGRVPPNPGEVLASEAVLRLLRWLARGWDIVVVDTAPIGPVSDTLPLAAGADGTLLIARAGQTRRGELRWALEALGQTGRPVLGVVLNALAPSPLARFGPYAYYRYGYDAAYHRGYQTAGDGAEGNRDGRVDGRRRPRWPRLGRPARAVRAGREQSER